MSDTEGDGATHTQFVTKRRGAVHHAGDGEADGGSYALSCEEPSDGGAHPKWPGGAYRHHAQGVFW